MKKINKPQNKTKKQLHSTLPHKHTSSAFSNNTAPLQHSVCMFLQIPPGGNRHRGYSTAIQSPRPVVSLQLFSSIFQTPITATAVFAVSQASPVYLKGSAHPAIPVEARQQASRWRDSKETGILNVFSRQSEPGETAGCWLCLSLQEDFCWHSREKAGSPRRRGAVGFQSRGCQ